MLLRTASTFGAFDTEGVAKLDGVDFFFLDFCVEAMLAFTADLGLCIATRKHFQNYHISKITFRVYLVVGRAINDLLWLYEFITWTIEKGMRKIFCRKTGKEYVWLKL